MKNVLIIFASETGATKNASYIIKSALEKHNIHSSVRPVSDVTEVKGVDCVFLGSPILYGKCKKEMRLFIQRFQAELKQIPVYQFLTCMRCTSFTDSSLSISGVFIDPSFNEPSKAQEDMSAMEKSHAVQRYLTNISSLTPDVKPLKIAFFKGKLDFATLGLFSRWVMKLMARLQKEVNEGDYINPKIIARWATEVAVSVDGRVT